MLSIFLDLETTGLDPQIHVPIEIALKIIDMGSGEQKGEYEAIIQLTQEEWDRRDHASVKIHGMTREQLEQGKNLKSVSSEIVSLFTELGVQRERAVFICQNPGFDRSFFGQIVSIYEQQRLNWPYHWLDFASMFWALIARQTVEGHIAFPHRLNLSKNAIAARYQVPPEPDPHRAMNGVDHLLLCYKTVIGII